MIDIDRALVRRVDHRSTARSRRLVRDPDHPFIPHRLPAHLAHVHHKDVRIIENFFHCLLFQTLYSLLPFQQSFLLPLQKF